MARQTKVFLIHDLPDKRFIQGKVMVPDSAHINDVDEFLDELEKRMVKIILDREEENV